MLFLGPKTRNNPFFCWLGGIREIRLHGVRVWVWVLVRIFGGFEPQKTGNEVGTETEDCNM